MPSTASPRIRRIEEHVRRVLAEQVAHDYKHVDRVRRWAVQIADAEGYPDLELVEAAALLHDIGLPYAPERRLHGEVGAEVAVAFLRSCDLFVEGEVAEIARAVAYHNTLHEGLGPLADIVRDADILDLLGAVGIMRAFTSKAALPEYDPANIKGATWRLTARQFDARFQEGLGIGAHITDQINFQISCYDNLNTAAARQWGRPLAAYMRDFLRQLACEIELEP